MKKYVSQHRTLIVLVGLLCFSIILWFVFKPVSAIAFFDEILTDSHKTSAYGEHCTVKIGDISDRSSKPNQDSKDAVELLKELSIDVISHIQRDINRSYRLIESSSPLGAMDEKGTKSLIRLETIFDGTNEYVRYDTKGPWIAFPKKSLAEMSDFIQKMFQDQFYFSVEDLEKGGVRLKEVGKGDDGEEVFVFRLSQTDHSIDTAKQLFQYPLGDYSVREQYGDVIIDPSQKKILKTILFTLFEYHDSADDSVVLDIPVYQECVPVPIKDLEVFTPSNVVWASKEEIQQYLLFKILPE